MTNTQAYHRDLTVHYAAVRQRLGGAPAAAVVPASKEPPRKEPACVSVQDFAMPFAKYGTLLTAQLLIESMSAPPVKEAGFVLAKDTPLGIARQIRSSVAAKLGITVKAVMGASRSPPMVRARQEISYRLYCELGWSQPHIGDFLGRDASTISYSLRRHTAINKLPPIGRIQ